MLSEGSTFYARDSGPVFLRSNITSGGIPRCFTPGRRRQPSYEGRGERPLEFGVRADRHRIADSNFNSNANLGPGFESFNASTATNDQ
jgi:hypothetical protein